MPLSFGCSKGFRKVTNTSGKMWLHFSGYLLEEGWVTWGQIYVGDSNYQWKWEPFEGTRRSRFFKQQAIHSCLNESLPESLIHLNWEAKMALSSFENCFNRIKCFGKGFQKQYDPPNFWLCDRVTACSSYRLVVDYICKEINWRLVRKWQNRSRGDFPYLELKPVPIKKEGNKVRKYYEFFVRVRL